MSYSADSKGRKRTLLFYLIYAIAMAVLCYGLSPLIKFYSTDSSVFYCMGKLMAKGGTAYTDFFDHKGLWLYFFNFAGASLDSVLSGFGMSVVETIFLFGTLAAADGIIGCFVKSREARMISSGLFMGLALFYGTYQGGNYTETYALTLQMLSIWLIVRYYSGDAEEHPPLYMFIHGVCAGICLFLRMNLVAMWVPFGVALTIRLIKKKKIGNLLLNYLTLVCGVIAVTIPVVIYGILKDCVADMLFCMWTFNMSYLGDGQGTGAFVKELLFSLPSVTLYVCFAGMVIAAISKKCSKEFKYLILAGFLFTFVITFMGKRAYGHYYQTLLPFALPVFALIGEKLESVEPKHKGGFTIAICICIVLTLCGNGMLILRHGPVRTEYSYLYETL